MKKTLLTLAAGAFLLSFASCKKDYTCTCTIPGSDPEVLEIKDAKKGDAKDACDAFGLLYTFAGGSCDLD